VLRGIILELYINVRYYLHAFYDTDTG
jgi:hypothetical protein